MHSGEKAVWSGLTVFCLCRLGGRVRAAVFGPDRIGVKPLFYAPGRTVFFASELKTLLAHPAVPAQVDAQGVAEIMLLGPGRTPGCGVFRVSGKWSPAAAATLTEKKSACGGIGAWKTGSIGIPFPQTLEHVRSLVTDAIRRQLVSDVPVCTFLSGGLDSSLISSVAAREEAKQGRRLHTFSVDYKDNAKYFHAGKFQPNSDPEFIEIMTQYLDTEHHWVILDTQELADALYEAVEARDLPRHGGCRRLSSAFVPGHEANGNRRPVRRVCRRNFRGVSLVPGSGSPGAGGLPMGPVHCVAQFLPLRPVQSRPRSGVLRFSPV